MSKKEVWNRIYASVPPRDIPWNIENPPDELINLVKSGELKPCRVLDLGCGTGNYSIYLASMGFEVIGIDISKKAIEYAKEKANRLSIENCMFFTVDATNLSFLQDKFDFIFDWGLLHHLKPEERDKYLSEINRLLKSRGKYLLVCFSDKSPEAAHSKKVRGPIIGENKETCIYYFSKKEILYLFSKFFRVLKFKYIRIGGPKEEKHIANYFLMQKI